MNGEQIFKDVTDIYSRLFNHKAALQGLNQNFVKEFEKQDETLLLSRSLESTQECEKQHLPEIEDIFKTTLGQVKDAVDEADTSCKRILKDETDKKTNWLEDERARRTAEWQKFELEQARISHERADADFEVRADSLRKHYADLEEKLSQGGTHRVL